MASATVRGKKLAGKVAVVTASTEGIGLAIARRLAQDGARVVISSRKQAKVDKAVQQLKSENLDVIGIVCHVGKPEHRQRLLEETQRVFGGLDILICNAGTNPIFGPILATTTEAAWDKIWDTNVKSTFFLCKEAVPLMEKRGGGAIVLVSSAAGYTSSQVIGTYGVTKTALLGLIRALTPELAQMNIRINCIAPGLIDTKFSDALIKNETILQMGLQNVPMGRVGQPEECAGVVSFLVSDDASYITGETTVIAGGVFCRL